MGEYRLSPAEQAERRLEQARKRALKETLLEKMEGFYYRPVHIERHAHEAEWLCRLQAEDEEGTLARSLAVSIRTPSPLDFGRRYAWLMLSVCPFWVEYWGGPSSATYRFSGNQRKK